MAKQNKNLKNKKGAPKKKQLKSNFPNKKEETAVKNPLNGNVIHRSSKLW